MISTHQLTFQYSAKSPEIEFPDLSCAPGEQLLLLGQSGSGKTTLLHLMSGMLQPKSGRVEIQGYNLASLNGRELDRLRGQEVGIVFQTAHFVQSLTVLENLSLPHFLSGKDAKPNPVEALHLLDALGVAHKAKSRPKDLSIGEQQRASIARALIHRPSVLLADEPTSALDDQSTDAVMALLEQQAAEVGASLIIVTHDQRLKDRFERRIELQPLESMRS